MNGDARRGDDDYDITGRLARFGRGGIIEDISEQLLHEFAKHLQESDSAANGDYERGAHPRAAARPPRRWSALGNRISAP